MSRNQRELTPAEVERLALLAEECGEVIQIVAKILRHGYESWHPNDPTTTNRTLLERELGDVHYARMLMQCNGDVNVTTIFEQAIAKSERVSKFLHYQTALPTHVLHPEGNDQ